MKVAESCLSWAICFNDMSLPYIWASLHLNGDLTKEFENNEQLTIEFERTLSQIVFLLESVKELDNKVWHTLCTGAGMTVYGAVALSWCKDAQLEQVWEGWEASGFPLLPKPEYERPARFINKELLPKSNSLKDITQSADNKSLPIAAMIVALEDEPLKFDLPESQIKGASPQVAAFLKKKAEAQGDVAPELIAHWSTTIEGTDYA